MSYNFQQEIEKYQSFSDKALSAFLEILKPSALKKGEYFLKQGQVPTSYAFIERGLFSYFHTYENGDEIIKMFFAEHALIASTAALIQRNPSNFSIRALEDTYFLEYEDQDYRELIKMYPEIAQFHIKYLEKNWVVAKEPLEIHLKYETAKMRYKKFRTEYRHIENRLKLHQIASYLGITPTQLSRIRKAETF